MERQCITEAWRCEQNPSPVSTPPAHDSSTSSLPLTADSMNARLRYVVEMVNQYRAHLPPLRKGLDSPVSYPFEISVPGIEDDSWGLGTLKRMLQSGPPSLMGGPK
eukprot:895963_1